MSKWVGDKQIVIEKYTCGTQSTDRYANISIKVLGKTVTIRAPGDDFPLTQEHVEGYRRTLADSLVSTALDLMTAEIEWRDGLKPEEET